MPKSSARLLSTDREIQTIRVDSVRAEFRIKGAKNLVLRVTGGGTKTWMKSLASAANVSAPMSARLNQRVLALVYR
jgi:hypothetical protein